MYHKYEKDYNFLLHEIFAEFRENICFPESKCARQLKYCSLQFLQEANYFRDDRMSCDLRENENVYFREN